MKIETAKTVAIAVLVSGIISFVVGVHYANVSNTKTLNEVKTTIQSQSK